MILVSHLAGLVGVKETELRLILALFLAYPIFLVHRAYFNRVNATFQHIYFIATGIALSYWTFGVEALTHNFVCILVNYFVLKMFGGTKNTVAFLFIFQMGYLAAGYFSKYSIEYDISWTMPQCILCLRLIGHAFDVFDGTLPEEDKSSYQKSNALASVPSLLETVSHVFFPCSYIVGPQHSISKFRRFIIRNINNGDMTGSRTFGFQRLALGLTYVLVNRCVSIWVPEKFVITEEFAAMPFLQKSFYFSVWVKTILSKYIGVWLITEGAVVISGLGYNGIDKTTGKIMWDGGANVKLRVYESAGKFGHIISSFNINTNNWCMQYVYKRCRFLNNKALSQVATMLFLAVWHGFHSGYYLIFLYEFLVINFEKQFQLIFDNSPMVRQVRSANPWVFDKACQAVGMVYVLFFLPHCFVPFALLQYQVYLPVILSVKPVIFIFFGLWPIWKIPVKMLLRPVKPTNPDKPAGEQEQGKVQQPLEETVEKKQE